MRRQASTISTHGLAIADVDRCTQFLRILDAHSCDDKLLLLIVQVPLPVVIVALC